MDCGDYVIVTNSRKVKTSGRKEEQLLFRKHSMFPGGLKETPYKDMKDRHPEEVHFHPIFLICYDADDPLLYRSSGMQYQACYLKTNYVNVVWNVLKFSHPTEWASWAGILCEAGMMALCQLTGILQYLRLPKRFRGSGK